MPDQQPILAAHGIVKRFGGVQALRGVDFDLHASEVHALVGENGAGKSTLIRVLAGLHRPDEGTLEVNSRSMRFGGPLAARRAGIGTVAQEFTLVPKLSVAENVLLGHEPRRPWRLLDWPVMRRRTSELLEQLGLEIDPQARAGSLSIADQQLVEIAKALSLEPSVLIMDEPTAALNPAEVDRLIDVVGALRDRGVGVLYVTHRLGEVFRLADRITVLRDGEQVATQAAAAIDEDELITQMLGRELTAVDHEPQEVAEDRQALLRVSELSLEGDFSQVSFEVRAGEVLGIAGLVGSGRSELMRALFGLLHPTAGTAEVDATSLTATHPRDALAAGVFLLAEDRKAEGLIPDLSVRENLFLTAAPDDGESPWLLRRSAETKEYEQVKSFLDIRADSPEQPIPTLSGGNQQKVLLGRAMASHARVLLLSEPTRGVDVGAKSDIYRALRKLAADDAAVVVSSSDALELSQVCDRCLVMSKGRAVRVLGPAELDEDSIVAAAVRGRDDDEAVDEHVDVDKEQPA
ncbi:MAG: sugar ABC transporter ATP-binding protein [Solirubrobacterales bacterium]|nr:sugar ABC transporter ATP-binding protein [Solirubrobacterales bacterium]